MAVGKFGQRNLVELDLALTSDDVPIASHGFNLWRVTSQLDKLVRVMHSQDVLIPSNYPRSLKCKDFELPQLDLKQGGVCGATDG